MDATMEARWDKCIDDVLAGEINIDVPNDFVCAWADCPKEKGDPDRYIIGVLKCRICLRKHLAAWPKDIFEDFTQECDHCFHRTCEPVTDDVVFAEFTKPIVPLKEI